MPLTTLESFRSYPAARPNDTDVQVLKYILVKIIDRLNEIHILPSSNEVKFVFYLLYHYSKLVFLRMFDFDMRVIANRQVSFFNDDDINEVLKILIYNKTVKKVKITNPKTRSKKYVVDFLIEDSVKIIDFEITYYCLLYKKLLCNFIGKNWIDFDDMVVDSVFHGRIFLRSGFVSALKSEYQKSFMKVIRLFSCEPKVSIIKRNNPFTDEEIYLTIVEEPDEEFINKVESRRKKRKSKY